MQNFRFTYSFICQSTSTSRRQRRIKIKYQQKTYGFSSKNTGKQNNSGGSATRSLPRDGGAQELHGELTVGPRPKVWNRRQNWKKWCRRWRSGEARMRDSQGGGESDHAECVRRRYMKNYPSVLFCIGKRTKEGYDRGSEVETVHNR